VFGLHLHEQVIAVYQREWATIEGFQCSQVLRNVAEGWAPFSN
jgi:hypothetical protein